MIKTREKSESRFDQLLKTIEGKSNCLILTHDNPDPDAIAAAMSLQMIIERRTKTRTIMAYGGIIGRAENKAFVKVLNIPLLHVNQLSFRDYEAFALVDSQPRTGNNSLPEDVIPNIVIDHHPLREETRQATFYDIRDGYGSTTTILFEYLDNRIRLNDRIATAIYYAIKSDTRDLGMSKEEIDRYVYIKVAERVNRKWLYEIEHPKLSMEHFKYLSIALQNARISKNLLVCHLGELSIPDLVPQVAEFLLPIENIDWILCTGFYTNGMFLSLRTSGEKRSAGEVLREVVAEKGKAGGHEMMAGGRITLDKDIEVSFKHKLEKEIEEKMSLVLFGHLECFSKLFE